MTEFKIRTSALTKEQLRDEPIMAIYTSTVGGTQQSIAAGASAALTGFDNELVTQGGISVSAGTFTLPDTGLYEINVTASTTILTATIRQLHILTNADTTKWGLTSAVGDTAVGPKLTTTAIVPFYGTTNTFQVILTNNSASSVSVPVGTTLPDVLQISIRRISL